MNKKDTEKDSERPHYYSQFWLDVAAGRREIGQKDQEETEGEEAEEAETPSRRRGAREQSTESEDIVHPVVEDEQEEAPPENEAVSDSDIPDVDFGAGEDEGEGTELEEGEDFYDEDDLEWGERERKKKSTRAAKPVKKPRRERKTF
uniref:Uncharacterized protein n=1 Tax=Thermosporothrix sp. COM3 TaxID=2490863 RepID=A0A455SN88_9CHLR|nr:hypothetical protein KTC_34020 [Thermosporothrix sp. COM3]